MKIPNFYVVCNMRVISLARIVSEDSQRLELGDYTRL